MTLTAQHGQESDMDVLGARTSPCLFPLAPALTHHETKHRDTGGTSLKTQRCTGHSAKGVLCFKTEISQGRIQPSALVCLKNTATEALHVSVRVQSILDFCLLRCRRMAPQGPLKPPDTEGNWTP